MRGFMVQNSIYKWYLIKILWEVTNEVNPWFRYSDDGKTRGKIGWYLILNKILHCIFNKLLFWYSTGRNTEAPTINNNELT